MKISFFEIEEEEKFFKSKLGKDNLKFFKEVLSKTNISQVKDTEVLSVFIGSKLTSDLIRLMPNLKLIVTRSTGTDHIDLKFCQENNIHVANVPTYGPNTVAEHTLALILALARKIPDIIKRTRDDNFSLEGLEAFELKGKTLGVIGTGNIGTEVIKRANAFEMNIIAYNKHVDKKREKKERFKYVSLNSLLKNSDIITLHLPLTPETKHLINGSSFKIMKNSAFIINTSRGAIIDTESLLNALNKKKIAGAALDVLECESDMKNERHYHRHPLRVEDERIFRENHKLLDHHNVLITPHCAFYTKEAINRILESTLETITSYKKGKLINKVK